MSLKDKLGYRRLIRVKVLIVCKVSACLLAAVHLQHLLQVGLRANESLLMLMIWELTTRSKLDCVLILKACSVPKKDASMLRGIRGGNGLNILSSLMQRFAILAAILNVKHKAGGNFRGMGCESTFTTNTIVIGRMLLK